VKKHGGQACPAERLNGKWYADNGLENLLVPKTGGASQILNQKTEYDELAQVQSPQAPSRVPEQLFLFLERAPVVGHTAWRGRLVHSQRHDRRDLQGRRGRSDAGCSWRQDRRAIVSPDARIEQFLGALAAVYEAPFENAGSNIRIFRLASYLRSESCNLLGGTGVWLAALLSPKALGIAAHNGAVFLSR
jgi:hypothetical protein